MREKETVGVIGLIPLEPDASGWPPGVQSFQTRPLFPGVLPDWLNNVNVEAVIAAVVVLAFWFIVSHKMKTVPNKRQFIGEFLYNLLRNGVARDIIGPDFRKFLPFLLALFSFILVNNWFGEFFVFMFPTMSKIGYVYALALASWLLYNGVGIWKYGPFKYLRKMTLPQGVPVWLWWLIIPLEFLSNIIVRPVTLALRLFANMFAGHLVTLVFVIGGTMLLQSGIPLAIAGGGSILLAFAVLALELLIGALQAYIFTVLTAQYVASALAEEH